MLSHETVVLPPLVRFLPLGVERLQIFLLSLLGQGLSLPLVYVVLRQLLFHFSGVSCITGLCYVLLSLPFFDLREEVGLSLCPPTSI